MINPYTIGGPVIASHFYNRRELLSEITAGRCRSTYVLGTRGMGKTSLLRQVETLVPAIFLDLQWAAGNLEELASQVRREVRRKGQLLTWLPSAEDLLGDDCLGMLETLNEKAEVAGSQLWVLMDEAEIWVRIARDDPLVLHRLRGIFQNCHALRVVMVAAKSLSEANALTSHEGSPFLSGFALRYLRPLEPHEARALLCQKQEAAPVSIDERLLPYLLGLCGGHPLILQLLGQRLYRNGKLRTPKEDDLVAILDVLAKTYFPYDLAALSAPERTILHALSSEQSLPAETDSVYLYGLTALGILHREGDYAIGNAFFARYLRMVEDWQINGSVTEENTLAIYTQSQIEPVLVAVQENRLALAEMKRLLDAIRRALVLWQQQGVPMANRLEAALKKPGGPRHKLEATIPLLPSVLAYKLEWGGEAAESIRKLKGLLDQLHDQLCPDMPTAVIRE